MVMLLVNGLFGEPVIDIIAFLVELLMPSMSTLIVKFSDVVPGRICCCGSCVFADAHASVVISVKVSNAANLGVHKVRSAYVYLF